MILTDATVAEAALTPEGVGFTVTEGQAIALDGDRIAWVGPASDAPEGPRQSLGGRLVTAGLIDCHTHLVHGGDPPMTGSEDFADMLQVVPGAYLRLGHAGTVPLHNPGFVLDPDCLPVGASILARIVERRLPLREAA